MVSSDSTDNSAAETAARFATTHWSMVLAAGDSALPGAQEALEQLCRTYWYPLYAFVRLKGHSPEDAKDLTQAFFERFLQKHYVKDVIREKALLKAANHFHVVGTCAMKTLGGRVEAFRRKASALWVREWVGRPPWPFLSRRRWRPRRS